VRPVARVVFVLQFAAVLASAKLPPLKLTEVSLMLRSGYSVAAVEQELSTRHLLDVVDVQAEKNLLQAGAPSTFIAMLKTGTYSVPAEDIAAAKKQMAAQERSRALQAEESKTLNTWYQDQLTRARAQSLAPVMPGSASFLSVLKGGLVTSRNGIFSAFNDQALDQKKLIALYFAARWCPSCRKFTPELIEYYNRVTAAHPEFEIVFISADRSESAMQAYMHDTQMPWPAVQFDKLTDKAPLRRYAGDGIPCLVLLTPGGQVISDSYAGKEYLGPAKVLGDLDRIFAASPGEHVALQR
jgi:thiol-disulfide isomerase/thioredoxin